MSDDRLLAEMADLIVRYEEALEEAPSRLVLEKLLGEKLVELQGLAVESGRESELKKQLELCVEKERAKRAPPTPTQRIESLEARCFLLDRLTEASGIAIAVLEKTTRGNVEAIETLKADTSAFKRSIQLSHGKNSVSVIVMTWKDWLNRQATKTLIWLVFVVGFALLDVIAAVIYATVAPGQTLSKAEMLGKGELLLVVAAISADAIGRLISLIYKALFPPKGAAPPLPPAPEVKIYPGHVMILIFAGVLAGTAAISYVTIETTLKQQQSHDQSVKPKDALQTENVLLWSERFMVAALLIGASTVLTVED